MDKVNYKEECEAEYCDRGCKYEDVYGFCTLRQFGYTPRDAMCVTLIVYINFTPIGLMPLKAYKLKIVTEYGFK